MNAVLAWLAEPGTWTGPAGLPQRVLEHVGYSVGATLLALALTLPPALWVGHTGRGTAAVGMIANVARAVPTFGIVLGAFLLFDYGPTPVYVALVALAAPPIVVNTVTGVRGVDREVREAAEGMGLTPRQVLLRVELPLALPLIMAGVRTAAVQVVATATLAAVIGLGGLGRPIVDGLAQGAIYHPRPRAMVVVGAVAVALLSALTELALGLVERAVTPTGLRARPPAPAEAGAAPGGG